jgi:hypothetical protein
VFAAQNVSQELGNRLIEALGTWEQVGGMMGGGLGGACDTAELCLWCGCEVVGYAVAQSALSWHDSHT